VTAAGAPLELSVVGYDHPDAVALVEAVQLVYTERYGGVDATPVDPAEFAPPTGLFLVGYADGLPVCCGGWRTRQPEEPAPEEPAPNGRRVGAHSTLSRESRHTAHSASADGDAELKRMYVVDRARGRGFARRLLAELERTAAAAGARRMVLETGTRQPEAIGLYRSAGYHPIPGFGVYRCAPGSRYFGKPLG
jgi:GNAT superfamily N-acetyltransferase